MTTTDLADVTIRAAGEQDIDVILRFIRAMAAYEGQTDICAVDEDGLRRGLFGPRPYAEVILAEAAGVPIGFALYFLYFSPYPGVPGLFMELLYVVEERRGRGIGTRLLRQVARIAVERGAGRMEWGVLKENGPAIGFYQRLGADLVDDFMACRIEGETLRRIADGLPAR